MANAWGGSTIAIDTQNDDTNYTPASDAKNGGTKYSSLRYKIKAIQIKGNAANDDIVLAEVKTVVGSAVGGNTFLDLLNLQSGELNKTIEFPGGKWVKGILPVTIGTSCKVLIHLW